MKLKGRFQQLGTQLIVFYMIISLVVLSAASYFIYSFMLGIIKENNETLLLQQFQQLDHNIDGLIADVDSLSKFFLLDDKVQRFLNYSTEMGYTELLEVKTDLHATIKDFVDSYGYIDSIYMIGDAQGAIGGTDKTTLVHTSQEWMDRFVDSDIFHEARQRFPELIIKGGIEKAYYNPYMVNSHGGSIISMARAIRPLYTPLTNGMFILNVDENYLSSIYSTSLNASEGKMFIVDKEGVIISSSKKSDIGTHSPYYPDIMGGPGYGSYDGEKASDSVQVVYYRLDKTGWYMVKEIPLNQFSNQIFSVQTMLVAVFLLSLIVIFVLSYFWLKKMVHPLQVLAHKMKDMSRGELGITFAKVPNNEFGMVIRRFNEMSLSIVDLIRKTNEMQEKRRELEMEALQNQINPHFLYNTLNMIRWMASGIKADQIVNSIVALGNILRPVFASRDSMCTLRDELNYLENYIKIINMRFSNNVVFEIDVDPRDLEQQVPRLILQPLIENAITHGSRDDADGIHIAIDAFETDDDFRITVCDSGAGIDDEKLRHLNDRLESGENRSPMKEAIGSGIGLYNVNKRIRLHYGAKYGVRLVPQTEGTLVRILLPKKLDE
ncbi:sensor histidine kinase [Paenibacillus sp. PAMC21692]|uniref:cache domain-containing sensor histidine kinase n=1 Tax=Paenibacillus sp. PAMC21692 TaxID=2762320 RepID=UPI00164DD011|nr:sensor histidine kinase [Paenibacillus sp. PAMC21692]QNK57039.1 sensor histidine kinase [Paenibacillus sp. PAMC21692]